MAKGKFAIRREEPTLYKLYLFDKAGWQVATITFEPFDRHIVELPHDDERRGMPEPTRLVMNSGAICTVDEAKASLRLVNSFWRVMEAAKMGLGKWHRIAQVLYEAGWKPISLDCLDAIPERML